MSKDIVDPSKSFFLHARVRRIVHFSMANTRYLSKHLQSVRVHDSESTQSSTLSKGFDKKRGSGFEFDFRVFVLRKFRWVLDLGSTGLLSHLPEDLGHLACNLGGTREYHRTVSRLEDTRVFLNGDQCNKGLDRLERSILFVVDDVTGVNLLVFGNTLDRKTDRVTWSGRLQNFLVLFDRENLLSLEVGWDESNLVAGSESSLLDSPADDLADTLDVVDVGYRQSKRSIGFTLWRLDEVVEASTIVIPVTCFLGVRFAVQPLYHPHLPASTGSTKLSPLNPE